MLGDLAVRVETEDIERYLLACTCEVVNGLKENLVTVLKSADIVDGRLDGSGSEILYRADKGVSACAVCEVMLDVILGE
jgi:hypothetical protein